MVRGEPIDFDTDSDFDTDFEGEEFRTPMKIPDGFLSRSAWVFS